MLLIPALLVVVHKEQQILMDRFLFGEEQDWMEEVFGRLSYHRSAELRSSRSILCWRAAWGVALVNVQGWPSLVGLPMGLAILLLLKGGPNLCEWRLTGMHRRIEYDTNTLVRV